MITAPSFKFYLRRNYGFTVLELIVACAIALIILGVSSGYYSRYRSRARDEKRKQDLHFLADALDLYYSDVGLYPPRGSNGYRSTDGNQWLTGGLYNNLDPYITVRALPVDPINNYDQGYLYWYQTCYTSGPSSSCMTAETVAACSGYYSSTARSPVYFLATKLETQPGYYCLGTPVYSCGTFISWGGCVNRADMPPS